MKQPESTCQATTAILIIFFSILLLLGYAERDAISKRDVVAALDRISISLGASLVPYFYGRKKDFEMAYSSVVIGCYLGAFLHQYLGIGSAVIFCAVIFYRRNLNSN